MRLLPTTALAMLALCTALTACGSRQRLTAPTGSKPIPTALGSKTPASPDQLMQQMTQARPDRSAEPLKRSQERQDDPFDLPPTR